MAPTSLPLSLFDSLGKPVAISQIEAELQELFLEGGEESAVQEDGATGIARASLINLALYNEDQEGLERDAEVLAEITSEAACRSLLIHAAPSAPVTPARAWVQVHCQIGRDGKKTVCTEQISFFLQGASPGLLRNLVFAHLDSDLPLAFWWRGEFSDAFEEGLHSRIDRLLFDSESWVSPRDQFIRLVAAHGSDASSFAMHDLAFTRLNSIRHGIANAFDRPALAEQLTSLCEVDVRYASGSRMSALYLAAWIAVRLEAPLQRTQSREGRLVFGPARKGPASGFTLSLAELDPERRGTVEVDFQLRDSRVEISRCQTRDFLRTLILREDGISDEDWLPAKKLTDAVLVPGILNRAGHNRTHSLLLPLVREFLTL